MTRYDLYLLAHIVFAVVWLGAGFLLQVQALRAERTRDSAAFINVVRDIGRLGNVLFVPAALGVLVFGLLMVIDGPWEFSDLWIVLGLAGYALTTVIGMTQLGPGSAKLVAMIDRHGEASHEAEQAARRLFTTARIELVVLAFIVTDMALKPTPDAVLTLAGMAALLVGGTLFFLARAAHIRPALVPA